jgi:predicted enzyme related to lactoylglutathione lyase
MDEPGSFCWTELNTRDMATARRFYREVFGWDTLEHPGQNGNPYTEWRLDGRSVGGGFDMTRNVPEYIPPHWLAHFAVETCDASAQKAQNLGGEVLVGPMDVDRWRFAVIRDPQGAQFAILQSLA